MNQTNGSRNGHPPGRELTFSWTFPVVLTRRCAWACGYCPYPVSPSPPLPSRARLQQLLGMARSLGLRQVRITGGEGVENHPEVFETCRFYGFRSYSEYLRSVLGEVTRNGASPPLFPELDLGALSFVQMQQLRERVFTLRLYLDSMDEKLQYGTAHGLSRGKWAKHRLTALISAGRLGIPVNSGLMVGIGEQADSRLRALETLARLAERYGHIQSVTIHPFEPYPRTPMANCPPAAVEEILPTVAEARQLLPASVAVQIPASRFPEHVVEFVAAGADDLGDFDLKGDAAADEGVLAAFKTVKERLAGIGIRPVDRLSLFPRFSTAQWMSRYYQTLLRQTDAAGAAAVAPPRR